MDTIDNLIMLFIVMIPVIGILTIISGIAESVIYIVEKQNKRKGN